MVYFLPSGNSTGSDESAESSADVVQTEHMADLKVFWGPEICRLEYLLHLVATGRIKDEDRDGDAELGA